MADIKSRAKSWSDWQQRSAYLDQLGSALQQFGLLVRHGGPMPQLHVSDPIGSQRSESVIVSQDADGTWWFWWGHAERIAKVDDRDQAARRVARVVCAVNE